MFAIILVRVVFYFILLATQQGPCIANVDERPAAYHIYCYHINSYNYSIKGIGREEHPEETQGEIQEGAIEGETTLVEIVSCQGRSL